MNTWLGRKKLLAHPNNLSYNRSKMRKPDRACSIEGGWLADEQQWMEEVHEQCRGRDPVTHTPCRNRTRTMMWHLALGTKYRVGMSFPLHGSIEGIYSGYISRKMESTIKMW